MTTEEEIKAYENKTEELLGDSETLSRKVNKLCELHDEMNKKLARAEDVAVASLMAVMVVSVVVALVLIF